jgi:hypothetical protein
MYDIASLGQVIGSARHGGVQTTGYTLVPNLGNILDFPDRYVGRDASKLSDDEKKTALLNLRATLDFFHLEGILWVGNNDFLPRRLELAFFAEVGQDGTISGEVIEEIRDYNRPLVIRSPRQSVPLEEFMESTIGVMVSEDTLPFLSKDPL